MISDGVRVRVMRTRFFTPTLSGIVAHVQGRRSVPRVRIAPNDDRAPTGFRYAPDGRSHDAGPEQCSAASELDRWATF